MKPIIYLRGNGGAGIGWGHISRLLALREILKPEFAVIMAVPLASIPLLQRAGLSASDFLQVPESDNPDFALDFAGAYCVGNILVLDGYTFDAAYRESAMKAGFRLVLIDDFAHGDLRCDLLINHAPASETLYGRHTEIGRCCCGTDYAMLRQEFYGPLPEYPRDANTVLVSMGGADPADLSFSLLNELISSFPELKWHLVITSSFSEEHIRQLQLLQKANPGIALHRDLDVHAMRMLMLRCQWAILASSTVVMEAWASGLYPAALCYTDNQLNLFRGAIARNMAFGFDIREISASFRAYLSGLHKPLTRYPEWNPPEKLRIEFRALAA
jgi:spore coat polysaccharide biosynthesis predicted glycosyltransferase SpsG